MKWITIRQGCAVALLLALVGCRAPGPREPEAPPGPAERVEMLPHGVSQGRVVHDGRQRSYRLFVPASLSSTNPAPLVLVFHGGGGSPERIADMTGFDALAEEYGFIVAYPAGTGSSDRRLFWNVLKSRTYATAQGVDDVGFVGLVLDDLARRLPYDPQRVYAAGLSQGGMLCYRLACDEAMSARLAAVAAVAAALPFDLAECRGAGTVSMLAVHGTDDPIILYNGGISTRAPRPERMEHPAFSATVTAWRERAGLPAEPMASGDRGAASMQQFGPGENGVEVVAWTIRNGGHTWPGGRELLPEWLVGSVNRDVNASVLIWSFFSRHRLPAR